MERESSPDPRNGQSPAPDRYVRRWLWLLTGAGVAAPALLASVVFSITDVRAGAAMAVLAAAIAVIVAVVLIHLQAQARLTGRFEEQARLLASLQESLAELEAERQADAAGREESAEAAPTIAAAGLDALLADATHSIAAEADALKRGAMGVTEAIGKAGGQAGDLADAIGQAGEDAASASGAIGRLEAEITKIGEQVMHSATIAASAVQEMHKANQIVGTLGEAAHEISGVADLINNIAGQTNLLALNATIEAARAGEAGKGFAVVAGEVKNLANQTAKATTGINEQIQAIQDRTETAVKAIQMVSDVIAEIFDLATDVAGEVDEQGDAVRDIAGNIDRIAGGASEAKAKVAALSAAAAEAGNLSAALSDNAGGLTDTSEEIRGRVETFLNRIAAG